MGTRKNPEKPTSELRRLSYERDAAYRAEQEANSSTELRRIKKRRSLFREGVKRLCASMVWNQRFEPAAIELGALSKENSDFHYQLAAVLDIVRTQVYSFDKGEMGFDTFYHLLSALGMNYAQLDPLPTLQERIQAGYEAIVYFEVEHACSMDKLRLPSPQSYLSQRNLTAILLLLDDDHFIELLGSTPIRNFSEDDWQLLASRVNRSADRELIDQTKLRDTYIRWGRAVAKARGAVPYNWIVS